MKFYFRHIISGYLLTLLSFAANSQVSVKATVDKERILIGEPIKLTLQAYTPLGENVNWFALDSIAGFEFIQAGKLDTVESVDNKKLEQTLVITSFDSGRVALGPLQLMVGDKIYETDSLFVDVAYKDFDPAADYKDIKTIVEVKDDTVDYLPWIIGLATLIAAGIIIWLLRKKKKTQNAVADVPALPPFEEAMAALENLKNHDFSEPDASKKYYTKLNDIFRVFITRRIGISSLEKTNDEVILQLKQSGMHKDKFTQLAQALRMSDFVKFAQYLPEKTDNDQNRDVIRSAIKELNNLAEINTPSGTVLPSGVQSPVRNRAQDKGSTTAKVKKSS